MAAPMDENVVGVFIEVRQQIRVAQVVLRVQRPFGKEQSCNEEQKRRPSSLQVAIHPSSVHVVTPSDGCCHVFPLTPIEVLPKTCNGLQWVRDEGVHMRLQLAGSGQEWQRQEVEEALEKEEVEFLSSAACVLACGVCGGSIVNAPCIFDRVLPLPSENWREMSENWCCHGDEGTRTFALQSLRPSATDCLVGNLHLLMHPSMLCRESLQLCRRNSGELIQKEKGQAMSLVCRRCRTSLGEASTTATGGGAGSADDWLAVQSVKLFKHTIRIQSVGRDSKTNNVFCSYSTETYLAKHLASMSQAHTTFKYILENENNSRPYLLLWLLSTDTLLLTSDSSAIGQTDCFHGHQDSRQSAGVTTGDKRQCCCKAENKVKTHAVHAQRIVKVLYQTTWQEEGKRLQQEWCRDMSVQNIPLPKATCLELMLILARSNQHSPASMREMNGFQLSVTEQRGRPLKLMPHEAIYRQSVPGWIPTTFRKLNSSGKDVHSGRPNTLFM